MARATLCVVIVSVSTVKDSAANVERFVRRNLGRGIDHMVVFTEDTGAETEQVLDDYPGVTHVRTGGGWWPERPNDLNDRQRLNANLARVLLAPFDWAQWLVHIDADEVVVLDPQVVAAFPPERDSFRMKPWEAVSRDAWPEGKVTHFKRLLPRPERVLLQTLGVIDKPIMHDDLCRRDQPRSLESEQFRIAGARTHQIDSCFFHPAEMRPMKRRFK